jgi:hypothetical protein
MTDGATGELIYHFTPNGDELEDGLELGAEVASDFVKSAAPWRLAAVQRPDAGAPCREAAVQGYLLKAVSPKIDDEMAPVEQAVPMVVVQRTQNMAVEDFISAAGGFSLSPSIARVDVESLDAALPAGSVFLSRKGESRARRRRRVVSLISAHAPYYVAATRHIGDEHWRLTAFLPRQKDRSVTLEPPWRLNGLPDADTNGCRAELELSLNNPEELCRQLLKTSFRGDTASVIKLDNGSVLPREPVTAIFHDRLYFVRQVRFKFFVKAELDEATNRTSNFKASLELVPDPRDVAHVRAPQRDGACLLGQLAEPVEDGDGSRLFAVVPASEDEVKEPQLKALVGWVTLDGEPLRAPLAVGAYERADSAGLRVRWKAGDLVLLSVADGTLPVILGAPRLSRPALKDAEAADMALFGTRVALAEGITVKRGEVVIVVRTTVKGGLDVE